MKMSYKDPGKLAVITKSPFFHMPAKPFERLQYGFQGSTLELETFFECFHISFIFFFNGNHII